MYQSHGLPVSQCLGYKTLESWQLLFGDSMFTLPAELPSDLFGRHRAVRPPEDLERTPPHFTPPKISDGYAVLGQIVPVRQRFLRSKHRYCPIEGSELLVEISNPFSES